MRINITIDVPFPRPICQPSWVYEPSYQTAPMPIQTPKIGDGKWWLYQPTCISTEAENE